MLKPLRSHDREHVGLVLGLVRGTVELADDRPVRVFALEDLRVVARGHGIEAQRARLVQQRLKLDVLVAAHARVGGAARLVLGHEVRDHGVLELLGHVPHVVRDAEDVGGAAGVPRIFDRAATARAGAELVAVSRERHVHAHNLVTSLNRERSCYGRVHSA